MTFRNLCFIMSVATILVTPFLYGISSGGEGKTFVSIDAYGAGETIPIKYTCEGEDVPPQIRFSGVPSSAGSLVLIFDDPDAPGGVWNHWILFDIPADLKELEEGYSPEGAVRAGANSWSRTSYGGPCPPPGPAHRYYFRLYALDKDRLGIRGGSTRQMVDKAMKGHVLEGFPVTYMGRFGR